MAAQLASISSDLMLERFRLSLRAPACVATAHADHTRKSRRPIAGGSPPVPSIGARSWVAGVSNGKATCSASGSVKVGERVVGEFNASEDSSMGAFSSDYLKMLDECVDFLTMDIADQIATGRYRSADD